MGNEASLEGGEEGTVLGVTGAPGSASASLGSGQHIKPVNGAAATGGATIGTGGAVNRLAGAPTSPKPGYSPRGGWDIGGKPERGDSFRLAMHEGQRPSSAPQSQTHAASHGMGTNQGPGQHDSRRNLQVDLSSGGSIGRSGRSPSLSPERGSAPSSPYSLPQIAPMPSSKLCPICNTTELTSAGKVPNFNKCTQCCTTVCNQCGFNPNPHLTEVQEWLCLNCQMQRALGMDMTTPRSKSQQQIHASLQQPKSDLVIPPHSQTSAQPKMQMHPQTQYHSKIQSQASLGPPKETDTIGHYQKGPVLVAQTGSSQILHQEVKSGSQDAEVRPRGTGGASQTSSRIPHPGAVPLPGLAKAPSQPELGRSSPIHHVGQTEHIRSAGNSPARRPSSMHETPPQDGLTKLFGFGASLLNQASTLISVDPLPGVTASAQPSTGKHQGAQGKVIFSDGNNAKVMTGAPSLNKLGTTYSQTPHVSLQKKPQQHQQSMSSYNQTASQMPAYHQKSAQQLPVHHQMASAQQQSTENLQKEPMVHHQKAQQQQSPLKQVQKSKVCCPLCKTEINIGSSETPNYNSCTQCHTQVCNMCGFNPTPHLVEKKEWLCLNCQTQRLMSCGLDDNPPNVPYLSPKHQQASSPHQRLANQQPDQKTTSQKVLTNQQKGPSAISRQQKTPGNNEAAPIATTVTNLAGDTKAHLKSSSAPTTTKLMSESHQRDQIMPKSINEAGYVSTVTIKTTYKKGTTEPIVTTSAKDEKRDSQRSRYYEETNKTNSNQDLSRSPQSLSDTGYSSDGISSSHSEITGIIHEEEIKLSEKSMSGNLTPPSPSEITKLESSMRPLLDSKIFSEEEKSWDKQHGRERHNRDSDDRRHRFKSLTISQEQYDSDEDLEDIMEEEEDRTDWEANRETRTVTTVGETKKKKKAEPADITDEEFMRRQIMEMSADEENEDEEDEDELEDEEEDDDDEGYGYQKQKKIHKHISDSGKEKHRLTHHSSSFEDGSKTTCEMYMGSAEEGEEDLIGAQGGLRRFKTIELNNTNSYSRDMELNNENDLSLDREPELEMESLTGSPEERSRGDYSSTLPPTTSSYNSGTSPTSISSMEDDSDSSPSRRQRLEEAKQQRKARHRSHGPLLPTIEDSSEEDELREEEELLREQEKMREVEQQRIRSTARKTKRDKEELRAQRRRERSKTPPSNLSPIEDASPTEELRQAAEMEELHRSSCSEYSPSIDSEAEGFEMSSKLYKSGSEYNLPTFMLLYSPTEQSESTTCSTITTTSSSGKPLKSAEEVYEEMMKKAEMLQKQQQQQSAQLYSINAYQNDDSKSGEHYKDEYDYIDQDDTSYENEEANDIYEEIRQTSQNITKQLDDQVEMDVSFADKQLLDTGSAFTKLLEQSNALLTPGTSPTQLLAPETFSETETGRIPDVRVTQHFSKDGLKDRTRSQVGKNVIIPSNTATTITAYGVYSRDAVHVSKTTTSQTMTSQQSNLYGRHTSSSITYSTSTSSMSNKIVEITQAYNQQEGRRASDKVQIRDSATQLESVSELRSPNIHVYYKGSPPLSPTSPLPHTSARSPSRKTAEFSTQTFNPTVVAPSEGSGPTSPVMAQATQTPHRTTSPRLFRQQSSQDAPFMVVTIGSEPTIPPKPFTVNTATSPLTSPTKFGHHLSFDVYSPPMSPPDTPPHQQSPLHGFYRAHKVERVNVGTSMMTAASSYARGSHSMENISLCRISTVPGTSRVEQGQKLHSASVADLRTATNSSPVIITDEKMDLISLAMESQKYANSTEGSPIHKSTSIQPLIMKLNTQEQPHVAVSTATTVSVTVAASMFISQPKHPVIYGDPIQNLTDIGQGMETLVCLMQNKQPSLDPTIPSIDAKLEDLSIQQQQLLKQQQKLQHQQQLLEQQLQQHHQLQQHPASSFTNISLSSQLPLFKKDLMVTQTGSAPVVSAVSSALTPEIYNISNSMELKGKSTVHPQVMMVQMDSSAQGKPLTQLIKSEEIQDARALTGQIKKENQIACCDVVYNLPFSGSCVGGPFSQKTMTNVSDPSRPPSAPPHLYEALESKQDKQIYHDFTLKSYTLPFPGRLQSSLSETNLAESGIQSHSSEPDTQASAEISMDLNFGKHGYEGGFFGVGLQYGSYTDLRQGDLVAPTPPIRRYSSLSNISSDYGYSSCDISSLPEANLAQYSATTAKEISRMCAALNSVDRYSSNPDQLIQGGGPPSRISLQQRLRPSFMYVPDGKPFSQALTSLINARQASLRAMFPSAIRSADGMIYSTINTPIASTVPITTQPTSVLHPLLKGVYRPCHASNMTTMPLNSLHKMAVAPRMPLTGQTLYQFPTHSQGPVTASATTNEPGPITTEQDAPIYLGKSLLGATGSKTSTAPIQPFNVPSYTNTSQSQEQPLNLSLPHFQTQIPSQPLGQLYTSIHSQDSQQFVSEHSPSPTQLTAAIVPTVGARQKMDIQDEHLQRQHEKILQLERERIDLEKLRQLRLQEELERERAELHRHREKEHMLVQQEIQELQTIKKQVLQQQQAEKENQLVLQREQLAQQKQQLDQIQSLQQQLQQHLVEQKRQKTAAVAAATSTQFICDQSGRIIQPQDLPQDMQHGDIQVPFRSLPISASEMCLKNNEGQADKRVMRKQRSMPRLQDGIEGEVTMFSLPTRIVDCSVQTDDEDEEEKFLMSKKRRTRRSIDCSVQTDDDEDKAEWEQPVRRRRSRFSRHPESDAKTEALVPTVKVTSSSIAIQTIQDCSCQTEIEQLGKISPSIHVTMSDPNKVEIVHYISGPERTQMGQSLACQTDPESHSQGVVVPQINVATTISPYSSSAQLVGSADPLSSRQHSVLKFERRKPDPLDIGYQQQHLHSESLSSVIRQPPKSPQVLYSPVSPSSPHRVIETSFSSSERLNKAHVTPQQKSYTAESPQRQQSLPRPIKNFQRSLSDPKPLSPTTDEQTKAKISLYQQHALQSQLMALQQSSLLRKVKRTLPSPPPEETQLSMVPHALPQMYVPTLPSMKLGSRPGLAAKASLLKDLTHELKVVEQESTKLRKQQAELEEEEKEIDAKLRYLELGITQRKETLVKERERRDLAYLRCMGDTRDYMSDSELNNLRLTATSESNGLLTRPSTAPLSQFTSDLNTATQFPHTSSFLSYQYPQSQSTATTLHASTFQSTGYSQPPYPTISQAQALPQPTPLQTIHHHSNQSYYAQGTLSSQSFPPSLPPYPTEHTMLPSTGFQPAPQPPVGQTPYPTHTTPYPSQTPPYPISQASAYQPLADILTVHQRPRQTSLSELEHKMPTNYEIISNPSVIVTTTAQEPTYSQSGLVSSYGQYSSAMASTYGPYSTASSSTYGGYSPATVSSYGLCTTTSANNYAQYTTTIANTYGHTTATGSSYGQYIFTVANTYGQTTHSDQMNSVDSPSTYTVDSLYNSSSLEQNVSRNYIMIDDITELTKEGMGTTSDSHRGEGSGRHGADLLHTRGGSSYGRPEDERDAEMYDHHHGRAYHLGQEETDWFEKPRDVRGSRHYSNSHSSSGRRGHVKHTYHDYDEPPEEDLWPQDEYGHSRHTSSREHRHHSSGSSARHTTSRHTDEPRSTRSSRSSKDTSTRLDSRSMSSSSAKKGDSRPQGYHTSDYSRDHAGHHHGLRTGKQSSHHQGSSSRKQQDTQGHISSSRQMGSTGSGQRAAGGTSNSSRQSGSQQPVEAPQSQRTQLQQQAHTSTARPGQQTTVAGSVQSQPTQVQQLQAKPGQTSPATRATATGLQPTPTTTKSESVATTVTATGPKATTAQPAKASQPPLTGIGSKAATRPVAIGSATASQPGMEGEGMFSKILPGGAAEQAGKLGEAISGFGKKFTSLW